MALYFGAHISSKKTTNCAERRENVVTFAVGLLRCLPAERAAVRGENDWQLVWISANHLLENMNTFPLALPANK